MDFFKLIGRWISRFFIFLGIIFFIFIFSITLLVSKIIKEKKKIVKKRSDSVLIVDFSTISGDKPKRNILESSFDKNISVYTFIKTLKQAENDPSIKGLIASTGNLNLSYAQISEIREALKSFKSFSKSSPREKTSFFKKEKACSFPSDLILSKNSRTLAWNN